MYRFGSYSIQSFLPIITDDSLLRMLRSLACQWLEPGEYTRMSLFEIRLHRLHYITTIIILLYKMCEKIAWLTFRCSIFGS